MCSGAMVKLVKVATCNLDQWAMDFDQNLHNICESIRIAKSLGCTFRTGPELEITGYGCQDHFLEQDTLMHSWQSIAKLLASDLTDGILCDVGMPVLHHSVRYNCRIFILNRKIVFIRPKMHLANDGMYELRDVCFGIARPSNSLLSCCLSSGNYRETRWFTAWSRSVYEVDDYPLPNQIRDLTGQRFVPFGICIVESLDTTVTVEACEELFTPDSPHILLGLSGAEIIANGSGSHHQLRKLDTRLNLMKNATARGGGAYLYSNQQGCDGDRLYFDGCACVVVNGDVVAQGAQFSVYDVEIVTATIDLDDIRSFRAATASRSVQAANTKSLPHVRIDFKLVTPNAKGIASPPVAIKYHTPQEEIAYGPACWLWDYLRRSGASGFFLPLSGGADSAATCAMVGIMCTLVVRACRDGGSGDPTVLADARRIAGESVDSKYVPTDPKELCNRILHTMYMGTKNSSNETKSFAAKLASEVGAYHLDTTIDQAIDSMLSIFGSFSGGKKPQFAVYGGSAAENLALQNLQARLRMVLAYLSAQLLPWVRARKGFLLVLGSANVDEALRGYMTKYDCSAADLNPIGGISKGDLKSFLLWASTHMNYKTLSSIVAAPPTAELEPITATHKQSDEEDMGMTYSDLGLYGQLRKISRCGPVAMYQKLCGVWPDLSPRQVAEKVKRFFYFYAVNRHKSTVLTPSYHAENYSPDDNRFDLRQFLYNVRWPRQFQHIEQLVKQTEQTTPPTATATAGSGGAAAATTDTKSQPLTTGVAVGSNGSNGSAAAAGSGGRDVKTPATKQPVTAPLSSVPVIGARASASASKGSTQKALASKSASQHQSGGYTSFGVGGGGCGADGFESGDE